MAGCNEKFPLCPEIYVIKWSYSGLKGWGAGVTLSGIQARSIVRREQLRAGTETRPDNRSAKLPVGKARRNRRGFTFVELLIVMVIIGILLANTIPQFAGVTRSAERVAVKANLKTIDSVIMLYRAAHGVFPDTPVSLYPGAGATLLPWPTGPAGAQYALYNMVNGIYRAAVTGDIGGFTLPAGVIYTLEILPW
jgi:prepilin-type N-terminal cleavage/methylation domain-containing protein